jgi:hypothetical protein
MWLHTIDNVFLDHVPVIPGKIPSIYEIEILYHKNSILKNNKYLLQKTKLNDDHNNRIKISIENMDVNEPNGH